MKNMLAHFIFFSLVFQWVHAASPSANGNNPNVPIDPFMGDYEGNYNLNDGTEAPILAQVTALGNGKYQARFSQQFDLPSESSVVMEGRKDGETVVVEGVIQEGQYAGVGLKGTVGNGKFDGFIDLEGSEMGIFSMEKTVRLSPTLGAEPPEGAIVLFYGSDFDEWEQLPRYGSLVGRILNNLRKKRVQWNLVSDAMEVRPGSGSIITKRKFTDFHLHLEFRTPFMPEAQGQARGNSGVYLQGRYEIQVLDSYGLEGKDNECGGIYKVASPRINMCAPPLQWQTYDVAFQAPRFDAIGYKIKNAMVTVLHNGVEIHDNLEIPAPTGGERDRNVSEPGGIYLQDHGNLVQYRNIWLVEE